MKTIKQFTLLLLCALLSVAMTLAQSTSNSMSQDVTIIIQSEQVRFTSQKAVQMMQLQIFNQAGEKVYDSSPMTVAEINWPLQNVNGEALKSGLYAYALSMQESGAAEARVRRGHFIVDRAQDRDAKTDKLWVTSQNESSIGTELTVARNESGTVAGTSTTSDRASERTSTTERDTTQREVTGRSEAKSIAKDTKDSKAAVEAATTDTFTVQTATQKYGLLHTDGNVAVGTWVGSGSAGTPSGWFGTKTNHPLQFFTAGSTPRLTIDTTGNIGIGTTTPQSKLAVQTNGYGLTHTNGTVTLGSFISSAAGGSAWFGTKSPHPLNFFTYDSLPQMTLDISGNLGIGTTTPTTKLHVLNTTAGTSAIFGESATGPGVTGKSTSSRGVYGESQSFIGVWGKSTSNSGVFGETAVSSLTAAGVYGKGTGSGSIGVIGESNLDNAVGVFGVSTSPDGVGVYARNSSGGRAVFAEGNVAQDLASNGLVKAMLFVSGGGRIVRCYNGITNSSTGDCGFVVTEPLGHNGVSRINFGFPVANRFVSVTAQYVGLLTVHNSGANYRFFDSTSVEVFTFVGGESEDTAARPFMIILY